MQSQRLFWFCKWGKKPGNGISCRAYVKRKTDDELRTSVQHGWLEAHYYALTAHFGKLEIAEGKKLVWVLLNNFVYSQGHLVCVANATPTVRRIMEVERRVLIGEMTQDSGRLREAGRSGRISTAFVERGSHLPAVCFQTHSTHLGTGQVHSRTGRLLRKREHLEWFRSNYHFVRPLESLVEELTQPVQRKGKQQARKYRKRTSAMLAGLTDRRWTEKDLLLYPLL